VAVCDSRLDAVILFFVISGFLITYLLLTEQDRAAVNVPKFYVRRICASGRSIIWWC
jgi:peptidoglycan/LPS O-acetylase OafA/YrhL